MRVPSVKTLTARLNIARDQAKYLHDIMKTDPRRALNYANHVMKGHGVETIGLPDGCFDNCQTPDVTIEYANKGNTYDTTLLRVNGQFKVGAWGDVVEAYDSAR